MRYLIIALFLTICTVSGTISQAIAQNEQVQSASDQILLQLKNAEAKTVLVASHRGDWRNAPENSIQAIKNCIKMGVDIVEIDVQLTKDSVPVLMHDDTIDRTTTGKGKVSDWTLDSLKTIFLKNGAGHATMYQIPTLEEAMIVANGSILVNLDKCSDYMDKAYEILKKTNTIDQAIFKGKNNIDHVRQQYGSLLNKIIYMPIVKEGDIPQLNKYVDDFLTEYKPIAFEVIYNSDNSPMLDVIGIIKKNSSRVWVNTLWGSMCANHDDDRAVEDPDGAWGWVIDHGANIIQTDRPEMLLNYLRKEKLHE